MKKISIILMAGILALASCSTIEEIPTNDPAVEPAQGEWTITIPATKDVDTKALDLEGNTLTAYWSADDEVKVFNGTELIGTLDVTPDSGSKPTTAMLSGTFSSVSGLSTGSTLTLLLPRDVWNYTGQVGTLASIQSKYDYAIATVSIDALDTSNNTITTTAASFENQQSIYRFAFRKSSSAFSIKDFKVSSAGNRIVSEMTLGGTPTLGGLTVTPASATADPLFVSIRNTGTAEDTYNFIVTGSDDALYDVSKQIPARVLDVPGKFISATTMDLTQPSFAPASGTVSTSTEVL